MDPDNTRVDSDPHVARREHVTTLSTLADVVESLTEGLVIVDRHGNLLMINREALEQRGFETVEQAREHFGDLSAIFELSTPDGIPIPAEQRPLARALRGERFKHFEILVHRVDTGKTWYASYSGTPVYNEVGELIAAVIVTRDETEIRASQEALRRSEERYRLAARATKDAIWDWDLRTNRVQWNLSMADHFGWREALEGTTANWWKERVHPDDRDFVVTSIQTVIDKKLEHWNAEYRFCRADGSYASVLDQGYLLRGPEGQALRMVGAMSDLTERKQAETALRDSEQRYRTLMETVPEFVSMLRPDGSTEYLNQRWEEYTGLPVRMPGTTWSKAFHPEDKDRFLSSFYKAIAAGQSFQDEIRIRSRDGGYRWFLTRIVPMKREGEIFAWLGTATDIDIRKRTEEELRAINESLEDRMRERSERILEYAQDLTRSNQMLEQRNRELQDIAYVASHDLQEPLRKIYTFADLVKEAYADKVDAQGQFYIGRLQQASLHASELVRELLEFSHVVTPGGPFQKVDLNDVVKEIISDCAEKLEGTGGRIEAGTLPVIVADEVQIHQLLKNLVSNALKFRRPDVPPIVHIAADVEMERLDNVTEPQPVCTIEVRDNGIGFEEKYLDRIFSPFQRLHGKDEYPGTGMGLAISRRIAERHGGEITARSTPGEGSVFIVKLPTSQG